MEPEVIDHSYKVATQVFQGPFPLLLDLVEKRKLFINDVSLASVTEDFINYINSLNAQNDSPDENSRAMHHAEVSSFIVVAATLILIKSKSLLPDLNLTTEEEGDIKNLQDRLKLYELYTSLSQHVKKNFGKQIIFAPLERKIENIVFLPDSQITRESMMTFVGDALGRIPKKVILPEVEVKKVISIEEMLDKLTDRIQNSIKMSFKEFAGGAKTKEEYREKSKECKIGEACEATRV